MAYDIDTVEGAPANSPFVPVVQIVVDLLDIVLRRWYLVTLGAILGALVAWQYGLRLPDRYSAQAKIIVDEPPPAAGPADPNDLLAERRMNLLRRMEAIRSIPVTDAVHRILSGKLDPKSGATDLGVVDQTVDASGQQKLQEVVDLGLEERLKDPTYLSRLLALRTDIGVFMDLDSSMLTIAAEGPKAEGLATVPNTYVQAYRAYCLAQKTAQDRRALRASQTSLEFARQLLTRAESIENLFRRRNRLAPRNQARPGAGSASAEVVRRLAAQTATPPNPDVAARAEKGTQMRQTLLSEMLRDLDQLLDLEEELSGNNPAVTAKQLEILTLQDSYAELDALTPRTGMKRQTYEQELATELANNSGAPLEYSAFVLANSVKIADAIYSAVLSAQREIQVRTALAVPDVHLLEPAVTPRTPIGPDRGKIIRNGAAIGFAIVFMILLLREYGDARVRGVNAVTRVTGVPVIANFAFDAALDSRPTEESIIVQEGSFTMLAETMRELRTRLTFAAKEPMGKALLVTSAFSGDGKTFVASNLAVSLAQIGERVLLVDGDLRKPRLHLVFGVPNSRGFSDLTDPALLHELVRPCMLPNLHLLTSGPPIAAPAEFLSRSRTQEILRSLLARYDRVIFDTPPINLVADASNLAALSDTAVLIIRDGGCTESELSQAAERVKQSNVKLAGVVLNHVRKPVIVYGTGSAYGRDYYMPADERARPADRTPSLP